MGFPKQQSSREHADLCKGEGVAGFPKQQSRREHADPENFLQQTKLVGEMGLELGSDIGAHFEISGVARCEGGRCRITLQSGPLL